MILEALTIAVSTLVSIPLLMVGTECLVALLFNPKATSSEGALGKQITYKILMPAHNEAQIIAKTLARLIPQLPDANPQHIVLVADNCTDETAVIARSSGVTVLERQDNERRGKGYALDFGIQYLSENRQPAIIVVMDADCETTKASLSALIYKVAQTNRPAQMTYLMRVPEQASIKQKISGFAWMLKNKIRLSAMDKMGMPVTLTGTGMAFPWQVFETVKIGHGNIVEDMQLGIDCAINGYPPVFCAEAVVYSDFPEQSEAELSQRTRWEHGHLQTILQQVPVLVKEAIRRKNGRLFILALDIAVPPLSFQVMLTLSCFLILAIAYWVTNNVTAFAILLLSFLYFTAMLAGIWRRFGQGYLSAKELSAIPQYAYSKLSIYGAFIFKRQKEWVRTNRDP